MSDKDTYSASDDTPHGAGARFRRPRSLVWVWIAGSLVGWALIAGATIALLQSLDLLGGDETPVALEESPATPEEIERLGIVAPAAGTDN